MRDPIDKALTEFVAARERYLWNGLFDEIDIGEEIIVDKSYYLEPNLTVTVTCKKCGYELFSQSVNQPRGTDTIQLPRLASCRGCAKEE